MKVFLDTNIVLDAMLSREPFARDAKALLDACARNEIIGCIHASTATDIYFVLQKVVGMDSANTVIRKFFDVCKAASVTHEDLISALDYPITDLEDSLAVFCATREGADYFITRDKELLTESGTIKFINPEEFLATAMK
jgi:predicted nucleic acid-binding protein